MILNKRGSDRIFIFAGKYGVNMPKENVLIAEDESAIAFDIKLTVENLGYKVLAIVSRGEDIVNFVEKEKPSLIIADINLKGEYDGIEALARVREKSKIPFIFITAYRDFERVIELYHLKPCQTIYKPFDTDILDRTISDCLK